MSSFPNHLHGQARVDLGRKWGKASAAKRKPTDPDWREICKRGAESVRGQVLREGFSFVDGAMKPWRIVRSVAGRINQVDLVIDGSPWRTGSERAANSAIKYGRWPCY